MNDTITPGQIINFSSPEVHASYIGEIPSFGVGGPEGGEIRSWQERLDVSVRDDVKAIIQRSVDAGRDEVLGSVVSLTGQVIIWCRNVIRYTACVRGMDSVWMAPRHRDFFGDQVFLETEAWNEFWLSTGWPAVSLRPEERLAKDSPGRDFRRIRRADSALDCLNGEPVERFICMTSSLTFFHTKSFVGHMFGHMAMEAVVILPRDFHR